MFSRRKRNTTAVLDLTGSKISCATPFSRRLRRRVVFAKPLYCCKYELEFWRKYDTILADYEGDRANLPVGILIGIDYYYAFMTGKVVRSRAGPVACKARVGWVLSVELVQVLLTCIVSKPIYCVLQLNIGRTLTL